MRETFFLVCKQEGPVTYIQFYGLSFFIYLFFSKKH